MKVVGAAMLAAENEPDISEDELDDDAAGDDNETIVLEDDEQNEEVDENAGQRLISMDSLMESMTCPVCLEVFPNARNLSCGHTFCVNCLYEINRTKGFLQCPTCRQTTLGRPVQMPVNYLVQGIAAEMRANRAITDQ